MTTTPELVDHVQTPTVVVRGSVTMQEIREFYDDAFGRVAAVVQEQEATPTSSFGLYLSPPQDRFELEVGFVVSGPVQAVGDVVPSQLPGGRAARLTHLGPYDDLGAAWERLMTWVGEQGLGAPGPMWEVYVTEPTPETDPATLRTDLFCLVGEAD